MAGSAVRLGLPTHKSLAPTIVNGRLVPLYQHSLERLRVVTDDIRIVLGPVQKFDACLQSVPGRRVWKQVQGELPSSLAAVAVRTSGILAIAFPDSVWWPVDGFARLLVHMGNHDGVLGLFRGSSLVLDAVEVDATGRVRDITRHDDPPAPDETIVGYGAILARSEALRGLTDGLTLARQLADMDLVGVNLQGPYFDLGTPARYIAHHRLEA